MSKRKMEFRTNKITFTEKGVDKKFRVIRSAFNAFVQNTGSIIYWLIQKANLRSSKINLHFHYVNDRMNNEMETRKILPKFGFVVPEIKECIGRTITMERVYGENLHDLYKIEDIHNIEKISEEIGRRVKTMHDSGYALIDFAIENLMKTKNGMLVNYDGEYFTKNATEFEKINDKVTYIVSCLGLDSERYRATVKDFLDGYGENLTYTDILFISLFSGLYPLSFKENGYEFINRMRNPRSIMDLNHVRASL